MTRIFRTVQLLIAFCNLVAISDAFAKPNVVVIFTDEQVHNAIGLAFISRR